MLYLYLKKKKKTLLLENFSYLPLALQQLLNVLVGFSSKSLKKFLITKGDSEPNKSYFILKYLYNFDFLFENRSLQVRYIGTRLRWQ